MTVETFISGEIKNRIKNSRLIESKALAEPFLQTHQFPSLPLLPNANSIISLTTSPYKHPVSIFFPSFSCSFMSSLPLISPSLNSLPSLCLLFFFQPATVCNLYPFSSSLCLILSGISCSLSFHTISYSFSLKFLTSKFLFAL